MKFKMGDRVKIVKVIEDEDSFISSENLIGKEGIVVSVWGMLNYPYDVELDFDGFTDVLAFCDKELEIIE